MKRLPETILNNKSATKKMQKDFLSALIFAFQTNFLVNPNKQANIIPIYFWQ